jgi:hypothetical protein
MQHPLPSEHSSRFLTSVITPTPQAASLRSRPERFDISETLKLDLRKRWPAATTQEENECEEWIKVIFRIFGQEPEASNPQVEIMGKDYDHFLNFAERLKELLQFMTARMAEQKTELIATLVGHFRTHCVIINNLDYNHAANVCDAIGLFYGAIPFKAAAPPLDLIPTESAQSIRDPRIKHELALEIMGKIQHNTPEIAGDEMTTDASLYTPIQTQLLASILLRLQVIGTQSTIAHANAHDTEYTLPDEINLFLGKLPELQVGTYATLSLWLMYYNPTESLAEYLSKKAGLTIIATAGETTAVFLQRLQAAILENYLVDIQTRLTTTEETERATAPSALKALCEVGERILPPTAPIRSGGAASATPSSAEIGSGLELRTWNTPQAPQTAEELQTQLEQNKIIQYTQILRIIAHEKVLNFYNALHESNPEEASWLLKAFLRLQAMQAFDNPAIKKSYEKATEHQNKQSLYHPQLAPILQAWKSYISTDASNPLRLLLRAQQEKWIREGLDNKMIFKKLAQLVIDNLILAQDLITRETLSENQHKIYKELLNFDFLTPAIVSEQLPEGATARQNAIACLRANPELLADIHEMINTIMMPEKGLPKHELMRAFKANRDQNTFPENTDIGLNLSLRQNPAFRFLQELLQIKQLPPPGSAGEELFRHLTIEEFQIKSQYKTGEILVKAFARYLEDTFPEKAEQIQVIRAWIQYYIKYINFALDQYEQQTTPERRTDNDEATYRPATILESSDEKIRKAGVLSLLTHLKDSLDSYATQNTPRGKCMLSLRVITYLGLLTASGAAEYFSRKRFIDDPSGDNTNRIELDALVAGADAGMFMIGVLTMIGVLVLARNKLNAIQMHATISALKGEQHRPYKAAAITLNVFAGLITATLTAAAFYIIFKILPGLNNETTINSDDDTPLSHHIDNVVDTGRYIVLAGLFMGGISAVITGKVIQMCRKYDWCCSRNNGVEQVNSVEDDGLEPQTFMPAISKRRGSTTALLLGSQEPMATSHLLENRGQGLQSYGATGTTLHRASGIVREKVAGANPGLLT